MFRRILTLTLGTIAFGGDLLACALFGREPAWLERIEGPHPEAAE